jgi:excisionase family DNA binding protein
VNGAELIDTDGDEVGESLNLRATGHLHVVASDGTRRRVARTTRSGPPEVTERTGSGVRGWLTIASAAKYLDTTPAALRKRIERGQVPVHRFCGSIRLRAADLDKLMVPVGPGAEEVTKPPRALRLVAA